MPMKCFIIHIHGTQLCFRTANLPEGSDILLTGGELIRPESNPDMLFMLDGVSGE